MKLAVLSDIHGNLPALEAVLEDILRWAPERVVVNGDLVNRGPESGRCYDLLRQTLPEALLLRGNHETFVLHCADHPPDPASPAWRLKQFTLWTVAQLGPRMESLRAWEDRLDLTEPAGGTLHITHGSRLGHREGLLLESSDEALRTKLGTPRDLFVGSHTHRPFLRRLDDTLVVNTGSVGSPFDRDPRAAYVRLLFHNGRWRAEVVRVPFDRIRAERLFAESGFLDDGGPLARVMLREFHDCRGHMGPWTHRYHEAVHSGTVTLEAAVDRYLDALD